MSYTKTTWSSGDVVSSEKLNHIEQGVYDATNGTFIIKVTPDPDGNDDSWVSDKTPDEIISAYENGKLPIVEYCENPNSCTMVYPLCITSVEGIGEVAEFSRTDFFSIPDEYDMIVTTAIIITNMGGSDTISVKVGDKILS